MWLRRTCTLDKVNPVLGIRVLILKSYLVWILLVNQYPEIKKVIFIIFKVTQFMFIIKADGLAMSNAQYFSLMFEDPWHSRCYFYFLWPYVTTWRTLPIVKLFLLPNSGAYLYSAEGMTLISHRSQYQYSVGFCFYEKLIFPINHPPSFWSQKMHA